MALAFQPPWLCLFQRSGNGVTRFAKSRQLKTHGLQHTLDDSHCFLLFPKSILKRGQTGSISGKALKHFSTRKSENHTVDPLHQPKTTSKVQHKYLNSHTNHTTAKRENSTTTNTRNFIALSFRTTPAYDYANKTQQTHLRNETNRNKLTANLNSEY
ncbi:hypothetical protein VNO77_42653 [Canavalia gladiata]|uniref:Uncharacterized protein n=1 Tax=Canavalia gladiata TaxID=3824 RepID=A0AAN9JUW4_CANGL